MNHLQGSGLHTCNRCALGSPEPSPIDVHGREGLAARSCRHPESVRQTAEIKGTKTGDAAMMASPACKDACSAI